MAKTKFRRSREVRSVTFALDNEDTTATELFKLPGGAVFISAMVNVVEEFAPGDLTVIDQAGTAFTATNLDSTGQKATTFVGWQPGVSLPDVRIASGSVSSAGSTGLLRCTVLFALKQGTPI